MLFGIPCRAAEKALPSLPNSLCIILVAKEASLLSKERIKPTMSNFAVLCLSHPNALAEELLANQQMKTEPQK